MTKNNELPLDYSVILSRSIFVISRMQTYCIIKKKKRRLNNEKFNFVKPFKWMFIQSTELSNFDNYWTRENDEFEKLLILVVVPFKP